METFLTSLRSRLLALAQADGAQLSAALVLILLLPACLPRGARRRAWAPALLLLLHLLLLGLAGLFPDNERRIREGLGYGALFFLLASIGQSVFLLLTQSPLRRFLEFLPQIFL